MERASDSITPMPTLAPLTTFERLRDWWDRLSTVLVPSRDGAPVDRATGRLTGQLRQLFEESRSQRGGEVSARVRAGQIAQIYQRATLPQRAAILNLITHEFAPNR